MYVDHMIHSKTQEREQPKTSCNSLYVQLQYTYPTNILTVCSVYYAVKFTDIEAKR